MKDIKSELKIGIDTGGTFTDIVCTRNGIDVGVTKIPSTPSDPSLAIIRAVEKMQKEWNISTKEVKYFCHGTTAATNALIERKGGCVGLLTTEGFSDVIEIGRQMRRQLYEAVLTPQTPVFLAPSRRRKGIIERVTSDGSVLIPLDKNSVLTATQELVDQGIDSIAICFLFSFINPSHELKAKDIVSSNFPQLKISISSEVDPTFREYERTVVTAFDAYLKPVVDNYLYRLVNDLKHLGISKEPKIMQSRGGLSSVSVARKRPVRLFLSGPAAGVVGAASIGETVGSKDLISIDIGGTSCDIALITDGRPQLHSEGNIEGYPVRVNMVDVNTIGSGGGSLVSFDSVGGLRVGPGSAGADPGPVCYGRGGEIATVTDASIVLGYLNPSYFAGGAIKLDLQKAEDVIEKSVAKAMNLSTEQAAQGILKVINAQMAEGIRLVSIKRGYDLRDFAIVAFGGAGPLHATSLADELGIKKVIVPLNPGVLSATGLLFASIEHEEAISIQKRLSDISLSFLTSKLNELNKKCKAVIQSETSKLMSKKIRHFADVCYVGQSYHLEIELKIYDKELLKKIYEDFKLEHNRVYGHSTDSPIKIINLRSVHSVSSNEESKFNSKNENNGNIYKERRDILLLESDAKVPVKIYERRFLKENIQLIGPAIIEQPDTTTFIGPNWRALVHSSYNLIVRKNS